MKSEKQKYNDDSMYQIADLEKSVKKLISEIKALKSPPLAPDEVKILGKIREAVNVWGYDVVRKDENMLLYKKRELHNFQKLITKVRENMIK